MIVCRKTTVYFSLHQDYWRQYNKKPINNDKSSAINKDTNMRLVVCAGVCSLIGFAISRKCHPFVI